MVSERRIGTAEFQKHIQDLESQVAVVIVNQQNVMSQLAAARDTLHDVVVELGGAPNGLGREDARRSVRRRLHELEGDRSAAMAASAAVSASKKIYDASSDRRFSRREKLAGIVLAFIVATGPYITLAIHAS